MPTKAKSRRVKPRAVPRRTKGAALHRPPKRTGVESLFLSENAKSLEAYAGEILLIRGRELLAHSKNYADIEKVIQDEGIVSPFLFRVPQSQETNFV